RKTPTSKRPGGGRKGRREISRRSGDQNLPSPTLMQPLGPVLMANWVEAGGGPSDEGASSWGLGLVSAASALRVSTPRAALAEIGWRGVLWRFAMNWVLPFTKRLAASGPVTSTLTLWVLAFWMYTWG